MSVFARPGGTGAAIGLAAAALLAAATAGAVSAAPAPAPAAAPSATTAAALTTAAPAPTPAPAAATAAPSPARTPASASTAAPVTPTASTPPATRPPAVQLLITGPVVLPVSVARDAAGTPPAGRLTLTPWAEGAIARVVAAYRGRGYLYARAWYRMRNSTVQIHVDEGRMSRIAFIGAGNLSAFLYRVAFNLPHSVFHAQLLRQALADLRAKYDLLNAYYLVKEGREMEVNPLGKLVKLRVLQIYVVQREQVGWHLDISVNSTWGLVPALAYDRSRLALADDHFRAGLELGIPYRKYLFDSGPKLQWVHGALTVSYRTPRFAGKRLAVLADTSLDVSHYERPDTGVSYDWARPQALGNLVFYWQPLELTLGAGVDYIYVFDLGQLPGDDCDSNPGTQPAAPADAPGATPPADDQAAASVVRALVRLVARLQPGSDLLRRGQRTFLTLSATVATGAEQRWLLSTDIAAQVFTSFGIHKLLLRGHAVVLAGDIRYWDEVQLAGDLQRVFFDNRYWVHEAAQLEMAYRVSIGGDWLDLGLFYDFSVFRDRTRQGHPVAWANAFGPSLHLLLFDSFAIDLFVGFGFAPVGFDQTVSFSLENLF